MSDKHPQNAYGKFVKKRRAGDAQVFLVPTANAGERSHLSVQVPRDLARRLQDICYEGRSSGKYPWRTTGDVHRFLLVVGLKHFATEIEDDPDTLRWFQLQHDVDRWRDMRAAAQMLLDSTANEIQALLMIGQQDIAVQRLQLVVPEILRLEDVTWREWVVTNLRIRFPALFSADMPYASLFPLKAEAVIQPKRKKIGRTP